MSASSDVSPTLDEPRKDIRLMKGYLGQIRTDDAGRAWQLLRVKLGEVLVTGNWVSIDTEDTVVGCPASVTNAWKGFLPYSVDATAFALHAWVQIEGKGNALVSTGVGVGPPDQLAPSAATAGVFDTDGTLSPNARAIALEANASGIDALRLVEIRR